MLLYIVNTVWYTVSSFHDLRAVHPHTASALLYAAQRGKHLPAMSGSLTLSGLWRPWSPVWAPCTQWSWTQRIHHNFPETWRDRQRHRRPNSVTATHGGKMQSTLYTYIDQNVSVGLWKERKEEKCCIVGWHMTEGMRLRGVTYKDMETLGHFHLILFILWFLSWLCWAQNNNTSHIFTDLIDLMATGILGWKEAAWKGGQPRFQCIAC